jgi:hypothetical protein
MREHPAEVHMTMKFLPADYLAINDAFSEFCDTRAAMVEVLKRKPDERTETKKYLKWVSTEYEAAISSAESDFIGLFHPGELTPIVLYDGKELVVPEDYWLPRGHNSFANMTLRAGGRLEGPALDDGNRHLHDCPVVLRREEWDSWKEKNGTLKYQSTDQDNKNATYENWTDQQQALIAEKKAKNLRDAAKMIAKDATVDPATVERETRRVRRERERAGDN